MLLVYNYYKHFTILHTINKQLLYTFVTQVRLLQGLKCSQSEKKNIFSLLKKEGRLLAS